MSIAHDILPECFVDTNIVNTFLTYDCDEKVVSSFL